MEAYRQRVLDESRELGDKLEKLDSFIEDSPLFQSLDKADRRLLVDQRAAMTAYLAVLEARIDRFTVHMTA